MRISDWSSDGCSSDLAGMVFAPFHAGAAAEILQCAVQGMEGVFDDVVSAGQVDRAVRIGQAQGLLVAQRVSAAVGVVTPVAAGGLVIGRASVRERMCQSVWIWVGTYTLKKKLK